MVNSAFARFTSGVHDFRSTLCFWIHIFCLCKNLTLGFFLLAGYGHIIGADFSVFAVFVNVDMKLPVRLICDHLRSQNFCPKARKIRAVLDTHQDIIEHDAPVWFHILPNHNKNGAFEGHRKRTSPVRSQILLSPLLFEEVTATKNPCSLDDFLVA